MKPISETPVEERLKQLKSVYNKQKEAAQRLNAYITLRNLDEIEEEVENSKGPLKGVLLPVKDNISTKGIKTTCASKMLAGYLPPYDAFVVKQMKKHGASVVGKTNMDEFAMGSTGETSAFGPARNPWSLDRVPGGSSSGSAVAVAYHGYVSLGSDTGGSIRLPACYCGVLGLKPTYGLVSRFGLIPYAESLEQIGPFARFAKDLALLMKVLIEYDELDMVMTPSTTIRNNLAAGFESIIQSSSKPTDMKGTRIAYSSRLFSLADSTVQSVVNRLISYLRDIAHVNVVDVDLPLLEKSLSAYYIIAMVEASSNLARYDATYYMQGGAYTNYWQDTVKLRSEKFGDEVKRRIIMGSFASSAGYMGRYYLKALKVRRFIKNLISDVLAKFDFLLMPVSPSLPPKLGEAVGVDAYALDIYTVIPNLTGHPALTIPAGFSSGLPVGVQFMTDYYKDDKLVYLAYMLEDEIYDPRRVPE